MLRKGYTNEKQYVILIRMNLKEDTIKLDKFVYELSEKRKRKINRQKTLLESSLSIMLD